MLYDIKLVGLKADEIELLATLMELKGIGMGDASKFVDTMPCMLFEGIDGATAQKYKGMLEEAGAVLEVSHTGESKNTSEPEKAPEPVAVPVAEPEPVVQVKPVVQEVVEEEPIKQTRTIPAIPDEEKEPEPEPESLPKPVPVEMPSQSVFQINDPNVTPAPAEAEEEPVYIDLHSSCPKCGSTFITQKKVTGLFGGSKIKYICSACKHKF